MIQMNTKVQIIFQTPFQFPLNCFVATLSIARLLKNQQTTRGYFYLNMLTFLLSDIKESKHSAEQNPICDNLLTQ